MAAIPWKVRQRRSAQDRIDVLSAEVRQLRKVLRNARVDTLQAICRRIEEGKASTLVQLKTQLVEQIEQLDDDAPDVPVAHEIVPDL